MKDPNSRPAVKVEYYGTVRLRVGVCADLLRAETVAEALRGLTSLRPELVPDILEPSGKPANCLVILNARQVLEHMNCKLRHGDTLQLTTPDVGG